MEDYLYNIISLNVSVDGGWVGQLLETEEDSLCVRERFQWEIRKKDKITRCGSLDNLNFIK